MPGKHDFSLHKLLSIVHYVFSSTCDLYMSGYQVLARRYRPQLFQEVFGQGAIVTTLKNAIKRNSLAHGYLFCGAKGTGKTTLARVFAKALNCQNPSADFEPCNQCSSCKEITAGHSLDVLEIDGASHRGIDDIRRINETVGYATASGKYKIYIIDEVHMLTKEAFNALLKTLEEPPPRVKFFFATTEPHKVLPTILSRCQRFNLNRIPVADIIEKLRMIAQDLQVTIQEEALLLLAVRADGGLRDAESIFDQVLAFHEGALTEKSVAAVLGMMPRESLFELDRAGKEANLAKAFEIANQVFSQGKDVGSFIESLTEHFRNILLVKLSGANASYLSISNNEREKYETSAKLYSQEQCLTILDLLIESQQQSRSTPPGKIALESILLRILRSHQTLPIEFLVRRLAEIEQHVMGVDAGSPQAVREIPPSSAFNVLPPSPPSEPKSITVAKAPVMQPSPPSPPMTRSPIEQPSPVGKTPQLFPAVQQTPPVSFVEPLLSIPSISAPIELGARPTEEAKQAAVKQQSHYDTLLQFATVELEGTIQKKH